MTPTAAAPNKPVPRSHWARLRSHLGTVALMLAVFSFNLLGDAVRDILDPRLRT